MQHHFSWWFIDTERSALVNPSTNQCVRYVGRVDAPEHDLPSALHRSWMRFEYEDSECRYPLLVEWRNSFKYPGKSIDWRIDHIRSAQLWARENRSKSDDPPFGLWRRVDVACADALCCWPPMAALGPAPNHVQITGGWYNGAWTAGIYRFLSRGSGDRSRLSAWMPPLDAAIPAPWEFVHETPSGNVITNWLGKLKGKAAQPRALETALIRLLGDGLPNKIHCGAHLRSRDESRALIPVEFLGTDSSRERNTIELKLLYIDRDVICDCLKLTRHGSSGRSSPAIWHSAFDSKISRLEGGLIARHNDLSFLEQPLVISPDYNQWRRSVSSEKAIPRPALWHRLSHAVTEAWLNWTETEVTLSEQFSQKPVQMLVPAPTRVGLLKSRDSMGLMNGDVAVSLASPYSSGEPTVFDDYHGAPAVPTKRNVGWWSIDSESHSIRNAASNQRIQLVETSNISGWASSDWWFRYSDNDIEYPIFVRRRLTANAAGGASGCWEIDHQRSAERWRTSTDASASHPPFGLWRRVDEAVADALYCWKELDQLAHDVTVVSVGGWWNGAWHSDCRRARHGARLQLEKLGGAPAEPVLEALNQPGPQPWSFVECAKDVIHLDLAHMRRTPGGAVYLPVAAPLEGFQGQTSYLARVDQSAVFFPAFAGRRWAYHAYPDNEERYVGVGYFTYANESEFLSCAFDHGFLTFDVGNAGGRTPEGAEALLKSAALESKKLLAQPINYPIWRRFTFDLLQAWPQWRGSKCRLLDDREELEKLRSSKERGRRSIPIWAHSGITLDMWNKVNIRGGYVAGIYTPNLELTSAEPKQSS